MSLITCDNVSLGYQGKIVLENVNFTLQGGEYLCILGENGGGKSTLIKGLLKLKKPVKGCITTGDGLKATEIGYLPQSSLAQRDFPASVYEVVLSGRLNSLGAKPFYTKADKKAAMDNMELMGIAHMRKESYQELSGGQQQRVLLARAISATKKVILLDEPVAGLDPVVTQELYELIENINKKLGITVIMVSHDISVIKYASHILHLAHRQLYYGKAADYIESSYGKVYAEGLLLEGGREDA